MQTGDAGRAEVVQPVVFNLPLYQLRLVEPSPAQGAPFHMKFTGRLLALDNSLKSEHRSEKHENEKCNSKDGNGHCAACSVSDAFEPDDDTNILTSSLNGKDQSTGGTGE